MKKRTDFASSLGDIYPNSDGAPLDMLMGSQKSFLLDMEGSGHALEKVASQQAFIPPKLERAIRDIQACPDPDMLYAYDRALGAGEVYGPNNNGDRFKEKELQNRTHTFETHANCYRHHQSKDPRNAIGEVPAAAYNDQMHTTDLIMAMPKAKIQKECDKLDEGGVISTSMGAGVKYDVCSYCGNRARKRSMYCDHLRNQMLDIIDGQIVCADNPNPTFKDISIVVIPADPQSMVLRKIAELNRRGFKQRKTASSYAPDGFTGRPASESMYDGENRDLIHEDTLKIASSMGDGAALRTLHNSVGPLRPDEFQAVLRKDANCLRPDIVPYVEYGSRPDEAPVLEGRTMQKVASLLKNAERQPLEVDAKLVQASKILTDEEIGLYRKYRHSMDRDLDRRFFR